MNIGDKILGWVKALGHSKSDDALLETLSATDEVPLTVARATLLVDLALIDSNFDAREYDFVMNALKSDLGLSSDEAEQLIKSAAAMVQFRGSHSFAVELQKRLPLEQRKKIALELKQLIAADNQEDGFEKYLDKKLRDLLGVDDQV